MTEGGADRRDASFVQCCDWCAEPLSPADPCSDFPDGPSLHYACLLRMVIGSVAHLEQRCSCSVPGSTCGDPPGLTKRQAATAAMQRFLQLEEQSRAG